MKVPQLWFLVLVSLPFIQLGVSYYVSVSIALFVSIFFVKRWPKFPVWLLVGFSVVSLLFIFKSIVNAVDGEGLREVFLPLREWICFAAIVIGSLKIKDESVSREAFERAIILFLGMTAFLTLYQFICISWGEYFGFPISWFVKNQGTLLGIDEALYHQSRLRPTAFYGEPSYGAFIVFSVLVAALVSNVRLSYKIWSTLLAFFAVFFLQSMSGFLALFIFLIFFILNTGDFRVRRWRYPLIGFSCLLIALSLFFSAEYRDRLVAIIALEDVSAANRLLEPFEILLHALMQEKIFGLTTSDISSFYGQGFGEVLISNALLWLIIYYGFLSIPIFVFMFKYSGFGPGFIYLVLAMLFNGDIFSYDKAVVISLVIGTVLKYKNFDSLNNGILIYNGNGK